jgi:hypothetical protein
MRGVVQQVIEALETERAEVGNSGGRVSSPVAGHPSVEGLRDLTR